MKHIEIHPEMRGGHPTVAGTRLTVSSILVELADQDDPALRLIARGCRLRVDEIAGMLRDLADYFHRPFDPETGHPAGEFRRVEPVKMHHAKT